MLKKWIKTWRGKRTEMSIEQWQVLCKKLQKDLNLKFDLCARAYFELEVRDEIVEVWIEVDKFKGKVVLRTF